MNMEGEGERAVVRGTGVVEKGGGFWVYIMGDI
jgi:hypothetical protein